METIRIIKSLCALRGTNLASLERDLGYGNGSIAKPKVLPSDRLYAIAKYFGVTMEYLITGETTEYVQEIPLYDKLNSEGKRLVDMYAKSLYENGYSEKNNTSDMVQGA